MPLGKPPETSFTLEGGQCPRCGARIASDFHYCPQCAYHLRPPIVEEPPLAADPARRSGPAERVIALGGYLAFITIFLLVVLTGFRLFAIPDTPQHHWVPPPRDTDTLALDIVAFERIESGQTWEGRYADRTFPTLAWVDDAYRISRYEVTNDQYFEFLMARAKAGDSLDGYYPPGWTRAHGPELSKIYARGTGRHPVVAISSSAATQFCRWLWTKLGEDPAIVVDLPTLDEYLRAARAARWEHDFPWRGELNDGTCNLEGKLKDVDSEDVGRHGETGVYGLVGNAAEWVWGPELEILAVGWSFQNNEYRTQTDVSPFDRAHMRQVEDGGPQPDVGFRVVIRAAPYLPSFVSVSGGRVRFGDSPPELLPPRKLFGEHPDEREERVDLRELGWKPVREFQMARTAITNHQYWYFLYHPEYRQGLAEGEERSDFLPRSWQGAPRYDPGRENQPVEGVTPEQARAYARWLSHQRSMKARLPTAAEYLRAGREERSDPYPWGSVTSDQLVFDGTGVERPVSLLGRFGEDARIYGLCGNLPEYVTVANRTILAGGCYGMPASVCTLDSYMDPAWESVEFVVQDPDGQDVVAELREPAAFASFRVVLVSELP
ncbi:MAG: SUMF1/EgtB/PvdO family nonheme iron enzyme [Planctomycetota bacterium]|nr:SUMF1/EgtB/PvdO family nonheme iron enzyme [Planctomycetota bacterium]